MNPKSSLVQYMGFMRQNEWKLVVLIPVLLTAVITFLLAFGNIKDSVEFLVLIIPTISSIILGFMGMIMVAALSTNHIFDIMRKTPLDSKIEGSNSVYHLFVLGLFFNMSLELGLLFGSITIGLVNSAFSLHDYCYYVELMALLFFLVSSSLMFINNMDRICQVTLFDNP